MLDDVPFGLDQPSMIVQEILHVRFFWYVSLDHFLKLADDSDAGADDLRHLDGLEDVELSHELQDFVTRLLAGRAQRAEQREERAVLERAQHQIEQFTGAVRLLDDCVDRGELVDDLARLSLLAGTKPADTVLYGYVQLVDECL